MKIAFAGTPGFGALVLGALLRSGHEVAVVITQPDRPAGRGRVPRFSAVKELALAEDLRVEQPEQASTPEMVALLRSLDVRLLAVAAFGQILKPPLMGGVQCLNVHASLLPRYRGAAPIERAIMTGDGVTGVTIMEVEPKLDTGPIYLQQAVIIEKDDDAGSMYEKLGRAGGEAMAEVLDDLEAGGLRPQPQNDAAATYAEKITPADMEIDWTEPAWQVAARVRGLSPRIGAFTTARGQRLKVWRSHVAEGGGQPGEVIVRDGRLLVACGTGTLELLEVQPEGKRRMSAAEFLRGYSRLILDQKLA
ncbi:MAG: methionyl-tRNA formyltransferase [Thermoleophilia bacterium]